MTRNKMTSIALAMVVSVTVAASTRAAVIFDGSGDPQSVGYVFEGSTIPSDSAASHLGWQFDTESGSSQPGILYQNVTTNHTTWYRLDSSLATTELVRADGWFAEYRIQSIGNGNGPNERYDVWLHAQDDAGGIHILMHPDRFYFFNFDSGFAARLTVDSLSSDYHKVRLTMAPGDTAVAVSVDGTFAGNVTTSVDNSGAVFRFGDADGDAPGTANWDYIVINTEIPEPASLALTGLGLLLIARRRRSR